MSKRRNLGIAVAVLVAVGSLAGPEAASASVASSAPSMVISVVSTGEGATLIAAEEDASGYIFNNYYGCRTPYFFVGDGQYASGIWWATYSTSCKGYV
jgi:hypothetical protein